MAVESNKIKKNSKAGKSMKTPVKVDLEKKEEKKKVEKKKTPEPKAESPLPPPRAPSPEFEPSKEML